MKKPLDTSESLFKIADFLKDISITLETSTAQPILAVETAARTVEKAASGSWLGYQAYVYYEDFKRPPVGTHFSQEWGFKKNYSSEATIGDWVEFDPQYVENEIYRMGGNRDMKPIRRTVDKAIRDFQDSRTEILSLVEQELGKTADPYLETLKNSAEKLELLSISGLIQSITPNKTILSRDNLAVEQGLRAPPHIKVLTEMAAMRQPQIMSKNLADLAIKIGLYVSRKNRAGSKAELVAGNIFIGHGNSNDWKDLQSFLTNNLRLPCYDYNHSPLDNAADPKKLAEFLDGAALAFLIITTGDQHISGKNRCRANILHLAGLFQGRLGMSRAVILMEEGCDDFHDVRGISQIYFPKESIKGAFAEIQQVLEREKLIIGHGEYV